MFDFCNGKNQAD